MKNVIEGVLILVVLGTMPELSSAQVMTSQSIAAITSTAGGAITDAPSPIIPVANSAAAMPSTSAIVGVSLALNSSLPSQSCIRSSANQVSFQYDAATNPATYTLSYTCSLTLNDAQTSVVSILHTAIDACPPLGGSSGCKNAALTAAQAACSNVCATYE
jgi:hypothetical protein